MYKHCGKINDIAEDSKNNFVEGTEKRVIFSPANYADFMAVRDFKVSAGVVSEPHIHPWAHCILGVAGKGSFIVEGEVVPVEAGTWAYVPQDAIHYFENEGVDTFEFICIVPPEGDVNPNGLEFC